VPLRLFPRALQRGPLRPVSIADAQRGAFRSGQRRLEGHVVSATRICRELTGGIRTRAALLDRKVTRIGAA